MLHLLLLYLHRGEADAIALANEMNADIALIDEREGRQIAVECELAVTGVLGILLRAKRAGAIAAVRPEIRALRDQAHFFVAQPAIRAARRRSRRWSRR
jgi:uncharacterized protein